MLFARLREVVGRDISAMNEQPEEVRDGFKYAIEDRHEEFQVLKEHNHFSRQQLPRIAFHKSNGGVAVYKQPQTGEPTFLFAVLQQWVPSSGCRLTVGDKEVKLWEASRKALEHFFFSHR